MSRKIKAAQFLWQGLYVSLSLSLSLSFPTSLQRASSCLIGKERIQLPGGGNWLLGHYFVVHKLNRPTTKYDGEIWNLGFPCRGSTKIPVSSSYLPCLSKRNNSCTSERIVIKFGSKKRYEIFPSNLKLNS
jgi:hypothetical protein